ncbi:MAG: hypothetical protein JXR70_02220 [Spirochaetales bacterium]|nr:hypothetical protein [Spirochaetales bacterium]
MSIDFYLYKNPLVSSTKYIPRTLIREAVDQDKLVDLMVGANTSLTGPDIKGMMVLLEQVLLRQLKEGNSVELGNILRLAPVVRGNFKETDLRKEPGQAKLDVNCRINKGFLKELRYRIKLEKKDHEILMPTISGITLRSSQDMPAMPREKNPIWQLHRYRSLYVRGKGLKVKGNKLTGLTLTVKLEEVTEYFVPLNLLDILVHTPTKFIFSFGPEFKPPWWLKKGMEMGFKLNFRHYAETHDRVSYPVLVVWDE